MTELRRQLEWVAALGEEKELRSVGTFERFVLKYGYEFSGAIKLPEHVLRGEMKLCFGNSAVIASLYPDEFIYTEGYALKEGIPLTLAHGWLTNRQGQVVDPTWGNDNHVDYFGVLIRHEYVRPKMGLSLIDDWQNGWPLVMSESPREHLVELEEWISNSGLGA